MPATNLICIICGKVYGWMPMFRGETIPSPRMLLCRPCAAAMVGPEHRLCQDCHNDEGMPRHITIHTLGSKAPPRHVIEYRCADCWAEVEAEAARQAAENGTDVGEEEDEEEVS